MALKRRALALNRKAIKAQKALAFQGREGGQSAKRWKRALGALGQGPGRLNTALGTLGRRAGRLISSVLGALVT